MSISRRPWRSILIMALVPSALLAAACAPPDAAGFRGTSGSGGTSVATDGAPGADAAGPAPFDGGACVDDAGVALNASAASGTFSGAGVNGAVCAGGAFAYLQSTPATDGGQPQIALYLDTVDTGSPAGRVRFQQPADALGGEVHVDIGLGAASAGTYDDTQTCGSVVLNAVLPVPASVDCAADAAAADGGSCPPGCELSGLLSGPACAPLQPESVYAATASSTLTLTSVTPAPQDGGGSGDSSYYDVHGNLTATLADQSVDAGLAGVVLVLSF
jgi:hypothetical protein